MADMAASIGFIGLGDQGAPMARHIIDAGWPTWLWARRDASLAPFIGSGAQFASSPRVLAQQVDMLCLCTFAEADLLDLLFREPDGIAAGLRMGSVLIVHNTVSPALCRDLAGRLAGQGVRLLDAPVAGGRERAIERRLAVMAGGDVHAFKQARPVFETYGSPVVHLGPAGSGQMAKILNNALMISTMEVADTGLALAAEWGLDEQNLGALLTQSSAGSLALEIVLAHRLGTRRAHQSGPGIITKDVGLFLDLCAENGSDAGKLGEVAASAAAHARRLLHLD